MRRSDLKNDLGGLVSTPRRRLTPCASRTVRTRVPIPKIRANSTHLEASATELTVTAIDPQVALAAPAQPCPAPTAEVSVRTERHPYDGETSMRLYLQEIGKVPLLTPEEEIALAARIKKGDK